ncbi:THNSL2 [Mytilus coruscus]|uniref:Threonine synthase-like 2 n=1 Tax=Mytilus coruscus TaxID=42192 RepID=A0A6J8A2S4_MYTCO|nr:THNSL2 [Mytilus coruscus]
MKYKSTRGGVSGLSFQDALYTGYAADGGILVPESIPVLNMETLKSWASLSYIDLAKKIVPLFVDEVEIPASDLNGLLDKAFAKFTHQEIAPIQRLKNGLNIMELFHGTTWAFKDLALSCVGQFLEYFLSKQKKHLTIVVGTSGDTGSAAIEAVKGFEYVDIIVLLPKGRCSKVQEQQMITAVEKNVHVYRVEGTSDDLDIPIKEVFKDVTFTKKHNLSSINSINWSRIMVQIVHYIYAYLQICPRCDGEVEIIIPTGACGNVTSGFIAKLMGVPIKFVCAVTQNDIVARAITKGDYSMSDSVIRTLAPAMDIQIPYNMERLWYLITQDSKLICKLMTEFESNGKVDIPTFLKNQIEEIIVATYVADNEDIKTTMRRTWEENHYQICPHTAIGVAYYYSTLKPDHKRTTVVIATASVKKFEEAVVAAGLTPQKYEEVEVLFSKPVKYTDMNKGENWELILRDKIEDIDK